MRTLDLTPSEWRDRDTRLLQEHNVTGTLQPFEKEYFRKDGSRVPVLIGVATFEEGGNQGAGEFRIVLPDGTIKYLDVTAHHRFSACGELVEIRRTNVDVTERKRAQDEHERLLRLESDL